MLKTSIYEGYYEYGKNAEKERVGGIILFAETDSTLLFYIDLNAGAPSYSMGALYGRVKIKDNSGIFYKEINDSDTNCKWLFTFSKNNLILKTLDGEANCEFGHGVFADGTFKKANGNHPDSFMNQEGTIIYFSKTKPEAYNE